ncbi:MAG: isocitrate/isopropylmalate dehydrogenase family protein [Xanthobacteraceae bacterium]|nr:isocitrate/isopropylmalate dehydrogenase family protein [Xanthobacteraceae bacterium]
MQILVLPGDGIGPEITAATRQVLEAASKRFELGLVFIEDVVGHESLRQHGTTVRSEIVEKARQADGIILGPTATADFKDPARGEINPSMFFRKTFDLFANIRPARTYPGLPARLGAFDLVVVRENTEGFYADRNMEVGSGEILVTPDVAISLRRITRACCNRIARAAFELAARRRQHVTIVHKANVLKLGDGLFLEECHAVARASPGITVDDIIVDAMMAHVVRTPQRFDVIVTTNMFGDILSDLTAELSGSLGLGGSLNAGTQHAMAQAAHGSAPDIAGTDTANPFSLILSGAQLLAWLGRRRQEKKFEVAADAIDRAVEGAIAASEVTRDLGGKLGTRETGAKLAARITS